MKRWSIRHAQAERLHTRAMACIDRGDEAAALPLYRKALEIEPDRAATLYNLGLIHKYRGEWELSLDYNRRAYALEPDNEAARWNLAIAATALRRWDLARQAWKDQGVLQEEGTGPIELNFGGTPVRLNPDEKGEVVWSNRIDPVRARIKNIPFPESGYRFADVVLHDGSPMGYRQNGGRQCPVFNVLELFESSGFGTWHLRLNVPREADLPRLEHLATAGNVELEDWTGSIEILCKACSEGTPHDHHEPVTEGPWKIQRSIGLAAKSAGEIDSLLDVWNREGWTPVERLMELAPA